MEVVQRISKILEYVAKIANYSSRFIINFPDWEEHFKKDQTDKQ